MNKRLWIVLVVAIVAGLAVLKQGDRMAPSVAHMEGRHASITRLTEQRRVASYLQQYQRLPAYYITKSEARRQGWDPHKGDLCDRLPGKAIGGDRFANREGRLPKARGRVWFEADVNYQCGHRTSDRLLWSDDGLIFVTKDHYRSFNKVK